MDGWDYLDEVDVIALWPADQKKAVESVKWSERRDALQSLVDLIEKNPRLASASTVIYGELIDQLKKILLKDSNVNVVAVAVKLLTCLSRGLRSKFVPFVSMIFLPLLEKTKDKKPLVRDILPDCLDAIADTCPLDRLTKDLVSIFGKPSPQTKQMVDRFLYRVFKKQFEPPIPFMKELLPLVVKHASDADPDVRDAACAALGSAKRLLGAALDSYLKPINTEEAKISKINEYCETATKEFAEEQAARNAGSPAMRSDDTAVGSEEVPSSSSETNTNTPTAVDPWDLLDPVNVGEKLPKDWTTLLESKKWQERKDAMDTLEKILTDNPRVEKCDNHHERIPQLIKILQKDVNINVCAGAAVCLQKLADGLRSDYSPFAAKTLTANFEKFKEKKAVLKDKLIELSDAVALTTPLCGYVEELSVGLSLPNPTARAQTTLFLARLLAQHSPSTLPKDDVKAIVPCLVKLTGDADSDVREASFQALAAIRRCVGENVAASLMDEVEKAKLVKIEEACAKLIEEKGTSASPAILRLYKPSVVSAKSASTAKKPVPTASVKPVPKAPNTSRTVARPMAPADGRRKHRDISTPLRRSETCADLRSNGARAPLRQLNRNTSVPKMHVPHVKSGEKVNRSSSHVTVSTIGGSVPVRAATARPLVTTRPAPSSRPTSRPTSAAGSRATSPKRTAAAPNIVRTGSQPQIVRNAVRPNILTSNGSATSAARTGVTPKPGPTVQVRPMTSAGRPSIASQRPSTGVRPNMAAGIRPNIRPFSSVNPSPATLTSAGISKPAAQVLPRPATGIVRPSTGIRAPAPVNLAGSKMKPFKPNVVRHTPQTTTTE